MKQIHNILIIIQRSNGDVFLSAPLIEVLHHYYENVNIDLLVNDDTFALAKTIKYIRNIHLFSYQKKKENALQQEKNIFKSIYKKYNLSINLTSSDRSVMYAIWASKYSVSVVEKEQQKSWWKRLFLTHSYVYNSTLSIVVNNMMSLRLLGIPYSKIETKACYSEAAKQSIVRKLCENNIDKFIIFHPSAQYDYKIYPTDLRHKLLNLLNNLDIPIVVTGANSNIDDSIKSKLPKLGSVYDFIGHTSLDEYIALSDLSEGYIGMDTLNMHIAAAQNKRVFAIFGPTILDMWSPWSNTLQKNTTTNKPLQTYGNITIFQANMECVACGLAGCDDKHGKSDCLEQISPYIIFKEVQKWFLR